ncbi:MAG: metalloregulator ArsR/SmtB family transcription factor [Actinomycetota bacterium]|nr:metalloregulator ArsR/SmtB family transcription factor [Actinomycetota bacterium]
MTRPLYEAKADFFRILGHPARIRVLELLCDREYAVHELLDEIEIASSNLSHQLALLRRTGLIAQTRRGGQVFYTISAPEIRDLLIVARAILLDVIRERDGLKKELSSGPRRLL